MAGEFCTTSVTSENLDDDAGWHPRSWSTHIEQEIVEKNPHIRWCETDSHGYLVIDVTPQRVQADWWYVDQVHVRSAGVHHGASWYVPTNEDRVRRAAGPVS